MNLDDLQWVEANTSKDLKTKLAADGVTEIPFVYGQVGSALSIDGQICLPVEASKRSFDDHAEVEIRDRLDNVLGTLVLTAGYELDLSSISDHFYMAYVTEVPRHLYGEPYQMRYSYVIINASLYLPYLNKYLDTAPLWGGFIHLKSPSSLLTPYKATPAKIVAVEGLSLPTPYHNENVLRSVVQPYAFERFQKLYHLLELRFDFDIVERIRALGPDLKGIGEILSEYAKHDELTRLKAVIKPGLKDYDAIEAKLNGVKHCSDCEAVARNIFFRYSKGANPLKEKETEYENAMALGGLSKSHGLVGGSGTALDTKYQALLVELVAYWIYRIRSSIVHSRIGEYVMSSTDEHFVVEVAEPLLREVVVQVFRA